MARQCKNDVVGMPCICGKDGNTKVSLINKVEMWKEYERKLLNNENEWRGELNVKKMKDLVKK